MSYAEYDIKMKNCLIEFDKNSEIIDRKYQKYKDEKSNYIVS
jgi:hypothetical protein